MATMLLRGMGRAFVGFKWSPCEGELTGLSGHRMIGARRFPQVCLRSKQGFSPLRIVSHVIASGACCVAEYLLNTSAEFISTEDDWLNTEEKVEAAVTDFILDGSKTTSIAHKVWRSVVRAGDTVIDATCGNGHDTLILAKMVLGGTAGYVIGLDLQQGALDKTAALLDRELETDERSKVNLLLLCHSQLDKVVDEASVRLVCFNLGYQPGGDKSFITRAESTVEAVHAATKVIEPRGLISIMAYVGHPGGQEEFEAVRNFIAGLPPNEWVCSHLEWTNRPLCPHLMFLLRK